jgi:hypothetical protein
MVTCLVVSAPEKSGILYFLYSWHKYSPCVPYSSYTSLIIASAMLFVFSSILICCVIYRHRWKIRYLYYVIKSRYRGTIKAPTNSSEIYYEYDAFVSYAEEDSKFILLYFLYSWHKYSPYVPYYIQTYTNMIDDSSVT